jgi:crotonobetainyl-CoA:carnitine CoA-transferase CaiB-like acyl-CoA transferase
LKNSSHPEESLSFWYNNSNKLGITLNLEKAAGKEIFAKLMKNIDVVVESFPPGYLDKFGLGFEFLSRVNPGVIMASVTGFGQNGPRRDFKVCDLVTSAFGGQMYVCGSPLLPPIKAYGRQSYLTASLYAAVGILLALRRKAKTGRGDHIDISIQEAVVSTLEHVMVRYFHDQVVAKRRGSRHWNDFFCILPCKDGFIHLTPFQQWETLVALLDSEGMAEDLVSEKWRNEEYRAENLDHVIHVIGKWSKGHTADELFELGQLMRLPWAPICSPKQISLSPQLKERGFFMEFDHAEISLALNYPGSPYRFRPHYLMPRKKAPQVGEDNVEVYRQEVGLTDKELEGICASRLI